MTGYEQYKENSILTSQPEELVLMLYNGLVKFIMKGQYSIKKNDIEKAHESIIKAQNIVLELMASLDKKYEVSEPLMPIYDYMNRRLIKANSKKSTEILDEVLGLSRQLRDTWEQAMKLARQPGKKEVAAV